MSKETELKKAWNMVIEYCVLSFVNCRNCMFTEYCRKSHPSSNKKIEVE